MSITPEEPFLEDVRPRRAALELEPESERVRLLDRTDWKIIIVMALVVGAVAFIGGFLGILAGGWAM